MFIVLPNTFADAATNMAVDAALLETLPKETAVFRHYGWTAPSCTFGYSQRHDEVATHTPEGVTLCRRMTGGGIVDHRNDWTYALILQTEIAAAHILCTDFYESVHRALSESMKMKSIECGLAPCIRQCDANQSSFPTPGQPSSCFLQPATNDVMRPDGLKIAGAAMKRNRHGLLLQGSIDRNSLPLDFDFEAFKEDFIAQLCIHLNLSQSQPEDIRDLFNTSITESKKDLFNSSRWNKKR